MTSTNHPQLCGLTGKGELSVGADADVTVIDPKHAWTIDVEQFAGKSSNCPFNDWEVKGRAIATIVGGDVKLALNPDRLKQVNNAAHEPTALLATAQG